MSFDFDDYDNYNDEKNEKFSQERDEYTYPEKIRYEGYVINDEDENNMKNDIRNKSEYFEEENISRKRDMVAISKSTRTFLVATVVILVMLLALLGGCFVYFVKNGGTKNLNIPWISANETQGSEEKKSEIANNVSINLENFPKEEGQMTAEQVYEKAGPSVVGIEVYDSSSDLFADPIGRASGVIISEDGFIVTNSHVVGDSTKYGIKIVLNTSEEVSGKVIGIDQKTDLAVIKADKTGLPKASFADSDQVKVGNKVLAIGNPGAGDLNFDNTLTEGIISGLNRSLGGSQKLVKYIQTSAAINSGNSGGALLNMYGQVVGINSVKLIPKLNFEGMGFAIPSNTVKSVVDSIIANGYVSGRVALGITGKMVSAYQSQIYNVPMGLIVAKINSDSDLNGKNIKTGDIIIKINDINVTGFDIVSEETSKYKVGESVKLTVYRPSGDRNNYNTFDVNVKLIEDKSDIDTTSELKLK